MENLRDKLEKAIQDAMVLDRRLLQIQFSRYMCINPEALAGMEKKAKMNRAEALEFLEYLIDKAFEEDKGAEATTDAE